MTQAWDVLLYVVLPLWVLAGFADYCCHRASAIEHANGPYESLLHWLMLAEMGLPLLLALFFRINALLIGVMIICLITHQVTGAIDLRLALATRRVTIFEHQVHSFLEVLPFTALLLVMILYWPQTMALFGQGSQAADFSLTAKLLPPWGELFAYFAAFALFGIAPYAEELIRGLRMRRANIHAHPERNCDRPLPTIP